MYKLLDLWTLCTATLGSMNDVYKHNWGSDYSHNNCINRTNGAYKLLIMNNYFRLEVKNLQYYNEAGNIRANT